jgi:hypothetical protein
MSLKEGVRWSVYFPLDAFTSNREYSWKTDEAFISMAIVVVSLFGCSRDHHEHLT